MIIFATLFLSNKALVATKFPPMLAMIRKRFCKKLAFSGGKGGALTYIHKVLSKPVATNITPQTSAARSLFLVDTRHRLMARTDRHKNIKKIFTLLFEFS